MSESAAADREQTSHHSWRRRWSGRLLCLYWTALFIGTHIPLSRMPLPGQSDKTAHFAAYAGLAVLFCWWTAESRFRWWSVFAILAAYAVADELLQYPVNRHPDVLDALADWVGILIGIAVFTGLKAAFRRAG